VKVFRETGQILGSGKYDPPSFDLPTLKVATADEYSPDIAEITEFM
jgi:hypothetical protein